MFEIEYSFENIFVHFVFYLKKGQDFHVHLIGEFQCFLYILCVHVHVYCQRSIARSIKLDYLFLSFLFKTGNLD